MAQKPLTEYREYNGHKLASFCYQQNGPKDPGLSFGKNKADCLVRAIERDGLKTVLEHIYTVAQADMPADLLKPKTTTKKKSTKPADAA